MSRNLYESELVNPPDWLLEIQWAGQVYRLCSNAGGLDVTKASGDTVHYAPGLNPVELSASLSGPGSEPETLSIPFTDIFLDVDVALLTRRGHPLDSATAEVSLLPRDGTYEDRFVVLNGQIIEPEWGDQDEPVSFSVEGFPWEDGSMIPPSTHVVTETTWPQSAGFELPDDSVGEVYPIVIGTPGWVSRSPSSTTSGSPAIVVSYHTASSESRKILIAGHRVGASTVVVFYDGGSSSLSVTAEEDGLGNVVSTVDLGSGGGAINSSSFYWIGWNSTDGGLRKLSGSGALEHAGDVCEWALLQSSMVVDRGRWAAAKQYLNRYRLAGYIAGEFVNPWQWLSENILPLLPVSVASGQGGLYPILWRSDIRATECVCTLVDGENFVRISRERAERRDDIINEIRLKHSRRARQAGVYRGYTVVSGNASIPAGQIKSHQASVSRSRYGDRVMQLSTDWVYGDDVAALIARDKIAAFWAPGSLITGECGQELGWLIPGMPVKYTDTGLHYEDMPCIVQQVDWTSETSIEVTLRIAPQITRDRVPT